ncbi:MAG: esterase-like activity of phytase family protein [Niabella sp.]
MANKLFTALLFVLLATGCTSTKKAVTDKAALQISSLKFLDEYVIPHDEKFENTWVGGLSGIDYDAAKDRYFLISDERSATSPARFYTAMIKLNNYKIDTVAFTAVHPLLQPDGTTFPSFAENAARTPDPESIRYNPVTHRLVWSSEGDKARRNGSVILQDPYIYEMDTTGRFLDSFLLPPIMQVEAGEKGPRVNGVFEGLGFANRYQQLYASVEEPLYEDGPRASPDYAGAPVRIMQFDTRTKTLQTQYAYLLDAVAREPKPANAFNVNGISEILYIGNNRLLVIERSFSTGYEGCVVKLYLADMRGATNVSNLYGLHQLKNYKPITKKLLLNFNDLNRFVDNVEGITVGPLLPNGHQSMIFVVDNNFSATEKTQLFLFEIIP